MSAADHLCFQLLILATDTHHVERVARGLIEPNGHPVESSVVVELTELRVALNEALDRGGVVLLCGGTHREARSAMRRVRGVLDEEVPGFAEVFRFAAFQRIGAAAMYTDAVAGFTAEGTPIFAVPGPSGAVQIALEDVILPGLHALQPGALLGWPHPEEDVEAERANTEAALRMARAHGLLEEERLDEEVTELVDHVEPLAEPTIQAQWKLSRPAPCDDGEGQVGEGWRAAIRAFRATLDKHAHPFLPDAFQMMVKARDALGKAGEKGVLTMPDGRAYGAFGFPDLRGPSSKVILVGKGEPVPELIALHRYPEQVGTCIYGEEGRLPSADLAPDPVSEAYTGFPLKEWGALYGLGIHAVYVERDGRVSKWNGMRERDLGGQPTAVAELIKEWSRR